MENVNKILTIGATVIIILLAIGFSILSIILNYHWTNYGIEISQVKKIKRIYAVIALLLFLIVIISYFNLL